MTKSVDLAIIIPCFNEEEILKDSITKLDTVYNTLVKKNIISQKSQIVLVNDGSSDNTWEIIKEIHKERKYIKGICLSRNFGHQEALLAGLYNIDAEIYITLDADLQDDIGVMEKMIDSYNNGNEIVYGVRNNRQSDSFFKKYTANMFYKIMKLLGVELVANHADYRLLSKRAVEKMAEFKERNLFLRAIVPLIGFKSDKIYYVRKKRQAGVTKYPLKKMILFALKGISSFSVVPLHLITLIGALISFISFLLMIWTVYGYFQGSTIVGWSSLMAAITFFSGITILFMGIIGEYIASIFIEVKNRPLYIIDKTLD